MKTFARAALCAALAAGGVVATSWTPSAHAQDDEDQDEGDDEGDGDAPDGDDDTSAPSLGGVDDAALRARLEPIVHLQGYGLQDGVVTLAYPLTEPVELRAFEHSGFDKVDLRSVSGQAQSGPGIELGAGSRNVGRLLHKLPLKGDVEVTVELWIAHNTPSAVVCFVLGEKVGVLWGQQIVKPSNMRPYGRSAPADPLLFKEERSVRSTFTVTGNDLVVRCQGSESGRHTFTKNELRSMRFGVIARNCRLVLTDLQLRGTVDTAKLR